MPDLTNDDFVFVEVSKTFMMTKSQACRLVSVARLLCAETRSLSWDEDGIETTTFGEDFLTDENSPDFGDATGQLADPEGLLNAELVAVSTHNLRGPEVEEICRFWPQDWREESVKRLGNLDFDEVGEGRGLNGEPNV